jgi:hypothetical protein
MRRLIAQVRGAIPFEDPAGSACIGTCDGCSLKLIEFLDGELSDWDTRLDAGERPGLAELSRLAKTSRKVYAVLERNGVVRSEEASPAE